MSDEGPADWKYHFAKDYDHQLLKDGDIFSVGAIELKTIHTPGHTPESVSFVLTDKGGGADRPMGIFTGDFVFVGSIGRPDLLEEAAGIVGTAEPGARDLYKSIQRFRDLPDYLQIWPAHGAGSACGKGLGSIPSSTVGYEKLFNPALQYTDEQEFVDYILSEQPEAPKYFAVMKQVNKEGPEILGEATLPPKLELAELDQVVANHVVVDTARPNQFAAAHVKGTINIQPQHLAMWGGSLIDYDQPVYLISGRQELPEVIRIMQKIGIEKIAGYFDAEDVAEAGRNTASIPQETPEQIAKRMESDDVVLVDVRGQSERDEEFIPGSRHVFLGTLLQKDNAEQFHQDKTFVFQCRTGPRAMIAASVAASIAERAGAKQVINLQGGLEAWKRAGLPVTRESSQSAVTAS